MDARYCNKGLENNEFINHCQTTHMYQIIGDCVQIQQIQLAGTKVTTNKNIIIDQYE